MPSEPNAVSMVPPLGLSWRSGTALVTAAAGTDTLYGIAQSGQIVALNAADGSVKWTSQGTYMPAFLSVQGNRVFAYQTGRGMYYVDDQGSTASEQLAVSFGASEDATMCSPAIRNRVVYYAVNRGLYALHQDQGLQAGATLSKIVPHAIGLAGANDIVTIDGQGVPTRYALGANGFQVVWTGQPHGVDGGHGQRPFVVTSSHVIVSVGGGATVAYSLATGTVAWVLPNVPATSFVSVGNITYAAFNGAALWALETASGATLWQRQFMGEFSLTARHGLAYLNGHLYFGATMRRNPDAAILMGIRASDGQFSWLSRSVSQTWAGGIPVTDGLRLYVYGSAATATYGGLAREAAVLQSDIGVQPRPLRGPSGGFGAGTMHISLDASARVSVGLYRESQGLGAKPVDSANWGVGAHDVSWSPGGSGGYSDDSQCGFVLVDVEESGGVRYTQSALLPINTFPDIMWHWARNNIEVMLYRKYVNGYEDLTFKPDNLVTRAESSTIIAKTLGLEQPSAGFQSKLTDIGSHWAKNYIMALEERGVIGGFLEPDGTYTFRPDLNMTRGQEARILVKAYEIPAASADFHSRFTDIQGHWAAPDILALEAAGYVNGFQEADGSFTYRPEQNLTRAELCTVVVRIRNLTR